MKKESTQIINQQKKIIQIITPDIKNMNPILLIMAEWETKVESTRIRKVRKEK